MCAAAVHTCTMYGVGGSLKVTDLATTNPVSHSHHYCSTPTSLDPERLLKKRETQKASECRTLAESQGGEFDPLVIGTHGSITISNKVTTSSNKDTHFDMNG